MFDCFGCGVRQTDRDRGSSEAESNDPSTTPSEEVTVSYEPSHKMTAVTHTDDPEYDLLKPHDLVQFLIDANIRLVSLRYLMDLHAAGRLWRRRQEAEQELVSMDEIENLKQATFCPSPAPLRGDLVGSRRGGAFNRSNSGQNPVRIYAISHCWEAQQHPDPFGFQCSKLVGWFASDGASIERIGFMHPDSTWLFIDYICLPQYQRTEDEQVSFSRAMKAMHVLYAHAAIYHVIRLEDIAPSPHFPMPKFIEIYCESTSKVELRPFAELALNRVPYSQRGWCIAEVQWMSTKDSIFGYAPLTPAMFQERVKRGLEGRQDGLTLKFTHRDDLHNVVRLQEAVFLKHSQRRKKLEAYDLPLQELQVLAETLPHFVNLEVLRVVWHEADVGLFDSCIAILKPVIARCTRLSEATVLVLVINEISDTKEISRYADLLLT
ncbi:unnamed protein product [Symbiodinium sp. CCMP2592]|nr:unnamed protein product [Symbiodinium sp. CCMP2592]